MKLVMLIRKIPNTSDLVRKTDYNTKIAEIGKKILDFNILVVILHLKQLIQTLKIK